MQPQDSPEAKNAQPTEDEEKSNQLAEAQKLKEEEELKNQRLFKCVADHKTEEVSELLSKGANPTYYDPKTGMTCLINAAILGYDDIVRILIKYNACEQYLIQNEEKDTANVNEPDEFKKPKVAAIVGKYNPLHWASYKNHLRVVWLLLKEGLSPTDIDIYGNTSIHQASAGGSLEVLECFMNKGVYLQVKNSRGHEPYDMATTSKMKEAFKNAFKAVKCSNNNCANPKFDFLNVRHLCVNCRNFFCKKCCIYYITHEKVESTEKIRPVNLCLTCHEQSKNYEKKIRESFAVNDFHKVDALYNEIHSQTIELDVKLANDFEIYHTKLKHELEISTLCKSLAYVPDYRTIKKSVKILNDKLENAKLNKIDINSEITREVNDNTRRLLAERNLRFTIEEYTATIATSTPDLVNKLQELIDKAKEFKVAEEYTSKGTVLLGKMNENIRAHNILAKLENYPQRVYPEPEIIDPKKKKKKEKKKEEDPKKKKKFKRKKREPPFIYPEWAVELKSVISEVDTLNQLLKKANDIYLDKEFISKVQIQQARFKKEIWFRKKLEDEAAQAAAEAKAAKEKARKKKK